MTPPAGSRKVAPGVYVLGEVMHLEVEEMLEANGYAATPENVRSLADGARELAVKHGLLVREVEEP
jgi:hypothetical protein